MRFVLPLIAALIAACSVAEQEELHHELDFEVADEKSDDPFSRYNPERIVADDAFFDSDGMTSSEVQRFLETTPYNKRSFLADERLAGNERFSSALVRVARAHKLNPLVLLVTLQKEAGLVSKRVRPSGHRINYAFGCGCRDGQACLTAFKGIDKQLDCAAQRLEEYKSDLDDGATTLPGWKPGKTKATEDGLSINPANKATAVLYTYTPWSLQGQGGNWLFWNVWRKYARHLDYDTGLSFPFNEGFIGGSCTVNSDCFLSGGVCTMNSDGRGICSQSCDAYCPDRSGPGWSTTFCAFRGGAGMCLAQCEVDRDCGDPQQVCQLATRNGDSSVSKGVCVYR